MPTIKHGTDTGYQRGCRKGAPCPATPTCNDAHNAAKRLNSARRARNKIGHGEGRLVSAVARRLNNSIDSFGLDLVAQETGYTVARLRRIAKGTAAGFDGVRVSEAVAGPLDVAWARLFYGTDPSDPTVEHGTHDGYRAHMCRCPKCCGAASKAKKRWTVGQLPDTWRKDPGLGAHTRALLEAAGSMRQLEKITGVTRDPLVRAIEGKSDARVMVTVSDRLRAWTPRKVSAARTGVTVPAARSARVVGRLWAAGYPHWWVAERAGIGAQRTRIDPEGMVPVGLDQALVGLYARIGDMLADPVRDGIPVAAVTRSRRAAARAGWWPPMMYDSLADDTVDPRAMPGHPWAVLDERAARALHAARMLATTGSTFRQVRETAGVSGRQVERWVSVLGLSTQCVTDATVGSVDRTKAANRAAVARILDVWDAYEDGRVGPVTAAIELGLMKPHAKIKTHPEIVAWLAAGEVAA